MYPFIVKKLQRNLFTFDGNSPEKLEFYEPLSEKSLKHKRALLVSAVGIIVVQSLGVEVQSLLGIKFTKVTDVSDISGLLFWFMIYQMITYSLSFWADIKVWNFKRSLFRLGDVLATNVNMHAEVYRLAKSLSAQYRDISALRALSNDQTEDIKKINVNFKLVIDGLEKTLEQGFGDSPSRMSLKKNIEKINKCLVDLDTTPTILKLKFFITFIMDYLIPLLLSLFSFFVSYLDGISVLSRIVKNGIG